jgi:hypothetical protein
MRVAPVGTDDERSAVLAASFDPHALDPPLCDEELTDAGGANEAQPRQTRHSAPHRVDHAGVVERESFAHRGRVI